MEKIHLSDKPRLGMSYSAVVCEFNVDKTTIYIK